MRILITGASGHLGRRLVAAACQAGHRVWAWSSPRLTISPCISDGVIYQPVDLLNPVQVAEAFLQAKPMAVIHAAALSSIADCYRDPIKAFRVNAEATRQLVGLCVAGISRLIYVSTDLVFDGKRGLYSEDDTPRPLSLYGKSKLDGERAVLHHPGQLVARLSWLVGCGTRDRVNFLDQQIAALKQGQPVTLFEDEWRTPLCIRSAASALVELTTKDAAGVLHLGGPERLSRHQMGLQLAKVVGVKSELIVPARQSDSKATEPRPSDVSLNSNRWRHLMPKSSWPTFTEALKQELSLADPCAKASVAGSRRS